MNSHDPFSVLIIGVVALACSCIIVGSEIQSGLGKIGTEESRIRRLAEWKRSNDRSFGLLIMDTLVPEEKSSPGWNSFWTQAREDGADELVIDALITDRDSLLREVETHWTGQPTAPFLEEFLAQPHVRWKHFGQYMKWRGQEMADLLVDRIIHPTVLPDRLHAWALGLIFATTVGLSLFYASRWLIRGLRYGYMK